MTMGIEGSLAMEWNPKVTVIIIKTDW
jgi:hypothetical protein